jgi:hypothetical protein
MKMIHVQINFLLNKLKIFKLIIVHLIMFVKIYFVKMENVLVILIKVNVFVIMDGRENFVKLILMNVNKEIIVQKKIVFVKII